MILTVTLNTALDRVLFIDEWMSGLPMRTAKVVTSVGGKGLDSSVVLRHLGVETVGLCFLAGETGKLLLQVVESYGIIPEPVWVDGETRIAHVIVERRYHRHSHIIAGLLSITEEHCRKMVGLFQERVHHADYVICAGSIPSGIPPDIYCTMTRIAHAAKVPMLIDSQNCGITTASPAAPDILKMNWDEFERTFQQPAENLEKLIEKSHKVFQENGMKALVLTCAEQGILAFTPHGVFYAIAPRQPALNAAGAGDAVSAALVWRLTSGDKWPDALRWAAATGAATVLTEGTADCRLEDIHRILPEVVVEPLAL